MGYITIDIGTTNTRIKFVEKDAILSEYKASVGVRDTAITGSVQKLKETLKIGIEECIKQCNKTMMDVNEIVAAGMVTSNLGLVEVPHVEAPVGIMELAKGIEVKLFPDIIEKPIYFIPGVKNKVILNERSQFDEIDMMRGEEVEALGALTLSGVAGNVLFISPGSHTKFVFMNADNKIEKCSTTLTGELFWSISRETILASSLPKGLIKEIDAEYIKKGMESARKWGFSKSCFLIRILDLFTDATENQRANFLGSVIAYYDIESIKNELITKKPQILIGGSTVLRELYREIFKQIGYQMESIITLDDNIVEKANAVGMIKVLEAYKKLTSGESEKNKFVEN